METANSSSGIFRTKSDQLAAETAMAAAAAAGMKSAAASSEAEAGGTLSKRGSKRLMAASPSRAAGSSGSKNTHIRKSRSAQLKLELEDVSSGAALSRASSASLGLSFSFTGFTMPPEDMADSRPFSDDDDIPEDLEAGTRKMKIQAEPTMPIYLKEMMEIYLAINATH